MKKLSPTFLIAAGVVTISLFVLLSMLFYGPSDYQGLSASAEADPYYGFRYTVASAFFINQNPRPPTTSTARAA